MSNPIGNVTQVQPVQSAAQAPAANQKASESKPQQAPADTVSISGTAKAILQELQENHVQTVQEANGGDSQARKVLAKEAAATTAPKG
jgi:hypothetical protein